MSLNRRVQIFKYLCAKIEEEEEQNIVIHHIVLNKKNRKGRSYWPGGQLDCSTYTNVLLDGSKSIFGYLPWNEDRMDISNFQFMLMYTYFLITNWMWSIRTLQWSSTDIKTKRRNAFIANELLQNCKSLSSSRCYVMPWSVAVSVILLKAWFFIDLGHTHSLTLTCSG